MPSRRSRCVGWSTATVCARRLVGRISRIGWSGRRRNGRASPASHRRPVARRPARGGGPRRSRAAPRCRDGACAPPRVAPAGTPAVRTTSDPRGTRAACPGHPSRECTRRIDRVGRVRHSSTITRPQIHNGDAHRHTRAAWSRQSDPGRRRRQTRRQASATCCSPTSPATRASWPASSRSTGSTSARASRPPTPCSVPSWTPSSTGVEPDFAVVKLEGDAVFAAAPAADLDGQGDRVLEKLGAMYRAFIDSRTRAIPSSDHICTACPAVAHLDLKVGAPPGPGGAPGGRVRQRPARPGGDGRAPPAQEHHPGPDRLPARTCS